MILVGLPGAGKSTAGRRAARDLGAHFVDLDDRIAAAAGRPVAELLTRDGEAAFRALERDAMDRALREPPQVIAPGGGWAAQPGNLEAVAGRGLVIFLEVSPAVAAARLGDANGRPLLGGGPLVDRLSDLLARREKHYRKADHTVPTEGLTADRVAIAITALARKHAGL